MIDLSFSGMRRLPVILQSETTECGLACLAMILNFHGSRITLGNLRTRLVISAHGLQLDRLLRLAGETGLSARAVRLEKEDLPRLAKPAILHWELRHFVVLKSQSSRGVVLHDPACGETRVGWDDFGNKFTGVAVELMPAPDFVPRHASRKLAVATFWQGCRGLWQGLAQVLVLSVLLQIFALSLPYYTQLFIDDVVISADRGLLEILAAGFFMVVLARSVTELLRSWVVMHLANTMGFGFGTALCRHLLSLPMQWFSRRHLGDIVSRFGSLRKVRDFMTSGLVEIMVDGLMVTGTLVFMGLYSIRLTLVALAGVLLYVAVRLLVHHRWRARNNEQIQAGANENSLFMENIRAIQGIRLFRKEAERLARWQDSYAEVINTGVRVQWLGFHMKFANGLLMGSENILLLLLGGLAVLDGRMTVGMLMAYMSYKDQCYTRVFSLVDKFCEFRLLDLHLERLADIALEEAENARPSSRLLQPPAGENICLQATGLAFRFPGEDRWLFRNLELDLIRGESVAIIGPTGCGKSTLLKVLLGLLPATEGRIALNGHFQEADLRVAGVLQDDVLLPGSLLENITFFDAFPDLERVEQSAGMAAIAREIHRMPMRYHTMVGDMGAALSGGQVQRLLLARALYTSPDLLLLDEATSHLDVATERRVNNAIRNLGATRLLVAHRPDSILLADRILALTGSGLVPVSHEQFSASLGGRTEAA